MSGIGGWIGDGGRLRTALLSEMSRAMLGRGRDQRGAYVWSRGWLCHNRCFSDGEPVLHRQPLTVRRRGYNYTVVLDGELYGSGAWQGLGRGLGPDGAAELALECYLAFGTAFASSFSGAYALAIWDEHRGELILARSRGGERPLYYARWGGEFAFASTVRALLRFLPGPAEVELGRLRAHLSAPCGTYGGEDLYRDIFMLPPGHCGVWSPLGLQIFPIRGEGLPHAEPFGAVRRIEASAWREEELHELLTELLFIFDYPQFDYLMPGLLSLLAGAGGGDLTVEDATLCTDLRYAYERADRLGQWRGCTLRIRPPERYTPRERELKRMDRALRRLLESTDGGALDRLLGRDWQGAVSAQKNTVGRIRMQGMLYQTVLWSLHESLRFC